MRTFAQKPRTTQPTASTKTSALSRAYILQGHDPSSILNFQRAMGNQALLRLLQSNAEEGNAVLTGTPLPHFGQGFRRIPASPSKVGTIQGKLAINKPREEYEHDADRVAERGMRIPETRLQAACPCGGSCPECQTEQADLPHGHVVQVQARDARDIAVSPVVHEALGSAPQPLDLGTRTSMEASFQTDLSRERVHNDGPAARLVQAVGARAYKVGNDVVFGEGKYTPRTDVGRRQVAHELAHVVQQSSADLQLDRQEDETTSDITQQIVRALNTPNPVAGVGDYVTAYNLLDGLSMPSMLRVLNGLAAQFMLDVLISRDPPQGVDVPRIKAALTLVRLANTDAASINQTELESFANNAQSLPAVQQRDMLDFASTARRISAATREGLVAMMASEIPGATPGSLSPAVEQGVTGPVGPGPWNPPGNQPIPYYIGNQAHIGIGASYSAAHPGDPVFTNFIPLSMILQSATRLGLTPNAGALSAKDSALKPDILNLAPTRRHLFEIKPTSLQNTARAEAQMYVGLLAKAGVPVTLGPMGEPGTNGAIPAPGGVYLFETPEAGIIVYQYRRQRVVPVPVPAGQPAYQRRWRLAPLTPQQQAVIVATTTAGVLLIIMMILLAPVGA
jgi:hypothetical protein